MPETVNRQHYLLHARQAGESHTATLEGREHLVFPAVLVQEQVLNNNLGATFLPGDEIEMSVDAWNGIDVTIRHPEKGGQPISARDPDVLNAVGVGRLFAARYEDGALKADVWIDLARVDDVEGTDTVLNAVNEGEPAELSTGFAAWADEVDGVHNGRTYEMVLRDIQPDHLALLVDEIGACSVKDGCGLGVNITTTDGDGTITWYTLNEPASDPDPDTFADRVWARLKRLITGQEEMSLDDIREAVKDAAEARWGGEDTWVWVEELFADDAVISVDTNDGPPTLYRVAYAVDEEGRTATLAEDFIEVERITEFVPAENGRITARHDYLATQTGEIDMTREELLNALCGCDKVELEREALEAMEDGPLAAIASLAGVGAEEEGAEEVEGTEAEEVEVEETEAQNEAPAWFTEFADNIKGRLSKLEEDTEPARNKVAEERAELIQRIADNTDFEADELETKPLAELTKIADAVTKPKHFGLMGGPRRNDPSKGTDLGFTPRSTLDAGAGEQTNRKEH